MLAPDLTLDGTTYRLTGLSHIRGIADVQVASTGERFVVKAKPGRLSVEARRRNYARYAPPVAHRAQIIEWVHAAGLTPYLDVQIVFFSRGGDVQFSTDWILRSDPVSYILETLEADADRVAGVALYGFSPEQMDAVRAGTKARVVRLTKRDEKTIQREIDAALGV